MPKPKKNTGGGTFVVDTRFQPSCTAQESPPEEMVISSPVAPRTAMDRWSVEVPSDTLHHCLHSPPRAYQFHQPPSPPPRSPEPDGTWAFQSPPPSSSDPMLDRLHIRSVRRTPDLPPSLTVIHPSSSGAPSELLSSSPPTTPTVSQSLPPRGLPNDSEAPRSPIPTPAGPSVPMTIILDPVTYTVVLVSGICTTLLAQLHHSHQSLLNPVFQSFADRVLKTKPVKVDDEIQGLLKQYATGFHYDGVRRAREEMTQALMHNWSHMGLDCATSAKDILSRDICKSMTKELREKRATHTLCESLLETVRHALDQCLARTNERIKELAQDHMIIIRTHDHQRLAIEVNALHEQALRGTRVSDNVRTVANEVRAYFNISSGEYIDGCIRIILRQFMHQLPHQLSSELLGALKLSDADLSERSRMWVE